MKMNIILAGLLLMVACKSKTKTETTDTGEKTVTDSITTHVKDSISKPVPADMGKVDIENFGPLKLGQHYSETQEFMGPPDKRSKANLWAADGLLHEDWTWKKNGLVLNMSSDEKI